MDLTQEDCQKVLENCFKTNDIKCLSFELKPISENSEGFMGEHLNLNISYELNGKTGTEVFFTKRKPTQKTQVETADAMAVYEKEILFYYVILKEYEQRGYDISFAVKGYHYIPNQLLVIENISNKGYNLMERDAYFDMDAMKCLLGALASYHGTNFAYERTKSKELNKTYRFIDEYPELKKESFFCQYLGRNEMLLNMWSSYLKSTECFIKLLPKDENYIAEFLTLFKNYKIGKIFVDETDLPKTLGHGDMWSNNMMFTFDGKKPTKCCLLDFQLIRYFYPAFDVILAIFNNTEASFREKHLNELYDFYYDTLSNTLNKYGYAINDIMTRDQFNRSVTVVKPDCLFQIVITNSVIGMPKENLTDTMNRKDGFDELMYSDENRATDTFKNNDKFRKLLTENLYDLYDAFKQKINQ